MYFVSIRSGEMWFETCNTYILVYDVWRLGHFMVVTKILFSTFLLYSYLLIINHHEVSKIIFQSQVGWGYFREIFHSHSG